MKIVDRILGLFSRPLAPPDPISGPRAFAPHCDGAVLHAPSQCIFCDKYPDWQAYRRAARVAFTGHTPKDGELPCPSEQRRSVERIYRWPGNRPHGADRG